MDSVAGGLLCLVCCSSRMALYGIHFNWLKVAWNNIPGKGRGRGHGKHTNKFLEQTFAIVIDRIEMQL